MVASTSAIAYLRTIAIAAIAAVLMISSVAIADDEDVAVTRDSWSELTLGKKVLAKFHYPWCEHCNALKPIWKKLNKKYKDDDTIAILDINCDSKKGEYLCSDFAIDGVPEIHWGDSSVLIHFNEKYNMENIVKLIETNMTEPFCSVLSVEGCPEADRADVTAIAKLTTDYLEKVAAFGVEDPERFAKQTVLKYNIQNPFWDDVSGIQANYGDQQDDDDQMSAAEDPIEEAMREL